MKRDLPESLHSTRDLLTGSLQMRASDTASPMPGDLFDDLAKRFNRAPATVAVTPSVSWFERVQTFIARPAFGVAAFAMVIVGFVLPGMMRPAETGSGFRGVAVVSPAGETVRIILVKAPSSVLMELQNSGDFEKGAISTIENLDATIEGAHVLVNFETSEIKVVNADGLTTHTASLPDDLSGASSAIASAVSRL